VEQGFYRRASGPERAYRRGGGVPSLVVGLVVCGLLAGCGSSAQPVAGASTSVSATSSRSAAGDPSSPATATVTAGGPAGSGGGRPSASVAASAPQGHQPFKALPTDVGRLLVTRLTGPVSHVSLRVWVWVPPQYDQPAYARTAFPALMLYPGGSGAGYNTWAGVQYHAREEDAAGAAAGRLTPFVFVMPEMQPGEHQDTECADLPGQPRIGTFLGVDVRRMVQDNFRVVPDRTGWGTAGASAGAYCAARIAFNHPDQYAAVVSIAGYFSIETPLRGHDDPTVRAQDPAVLATGRPPAVSVLLWAGGRNGPDLRDARGFLARVRPPTTAELRILPGGRHLTTDFARMMPDSLTFLSTHLAPPTPIP